MASSRGNSYCAKIRAILPEFLICGLQIQNTTQLDVSLVEADARMRIINHLDQRNSNPRIGS
jgi:hypothetical protein